MSERWEYKVMTLKSEQGLRATFGMNPDDGEATDSLNREGTQGWELVSVIVYGAAQRLFFKRAR